MNSERYSRQNMLPEFGTDGQQKLEDAGVLIIGATSIGSTLMYNLASAGVGTIGIADHNIVGTSNLNAPIHFEEDLGTLKVISAARKLRAYNSLINVIPHATAINKDNAYEIISQYDIVVLAVNNPQTAMLVNEACVELGKPFVHGKTNGFVGTAGFVLPHETPCLACFFGEELPPEENYGSVSGVSSTVAALMSSAVLQYLLDAPVAMKGYLFIYNCMTATIDKIELTHRHDCPVCNQSADAEEDYDDFDEEEV
ncbi:MAG: HesA/MoeB/ThiF family protein [Clostridia bacterium]|nr:HesA/MoeB/ThiF family protein [Clostridia bacterium]